MSWVGAGLMIAAVLLVQLGPRWRLASAPG
jgi:hypothetical protein